MPFLDLDALEKVAVEHGYVAKPIMGVDTADIRGKGGGRDGVSMASDL